MRSSPTCMCSELMELHVLHFHRFLGSSCVCVSFALAFRFRTLGFL